MAIIDSFWTKWKNPTTHCNEWILIESGDGIEFDTVTTPCVNSCSSAEYITSVVITSIPVGAVWTRFDLALTGAQETALKGGGLNLTGLGWTAVATSTGGNAGTWTVGDYPVLIQVQGITLAIANYTYAAGILQIPVAASENDVLTILRIGS